MKFVKKHLFLLVMVVIVSGFLGLQFWPQAADSARTVERGTPPNLSILVTRLPGTDLLHLFVQNLDPANGALISQEVFTLQRLGEGATIAHYTSSSPYYLSPAAVAQQRADGTVLSAEQQAAMQTWMREQLEFRLRQLDSALLRRTPLGVFAALRMVHEGLEQHRGKEQGLRPWVMLPGKPGNPTTRSAPLDLQLQMTLEELAYENLETFAKRLANQFQQHSSPPK